MKRTHTTIFCILVYIIIYRFFILYFIKNIHLFGTTYKFIRIINTLNTSILNNYYFYLILVLVLMWFTVHSQDNQILLPRKQCLFWQKKKIFFICMWLQSNNWGAFITYLVNIEGWSVIYYLTVYINATNISFFSFLLRPKHFRECI